MKWLTKVPRPRNEIRDKGIRNRSDNHRSGFAAEPRWKKILPVLTGYPTSLTKLQSTFYLYPLEEVLEDSTGPRRFFRLFEKAEVDRD
ncbi:MAG: hypothetical protein ABSE39_09895 [Candidatus Bathyarchaeia archaeon]|jgi:hypothetical protein